MGRFLSVLFWVMAVPSVVLAADPAPPVPGPICCACIEVTGEMGVAENGSLQEAIFCSSASPGDIDPLLARCKALKGELTCPNGTDPAMAGDPANDAACAEALKNEEDIACPALSGAAAPVLSGISLSVLALLLTGAGVLVLRRRGVVRG